MLSWSSICMVRGVAFQIYSGGTHCTRGVAFQIYSDGTHCTGGVAFQIYNDGTHCTGGVAFQIYSDSTHCTRCVYQGRTGVRYNGVSICMVRGCSIFRYIVMVHTVLGVCTREEPVYAIMEFHLHGRDVAFQIYSDGTHCTGVWGCVPSGIPPVW